MASRSLFPLCVVLDKHNSLHIIKRHEEYRKAKIIVCNDMAAPRTQEPPQLNLSTQIPRHQIFHSAHWSSELDLLVVLLLCLDTCACTCRTCQLRLGTNFTLNLSPSICCSPAVSSGHAESEFRRGGSRTGSLGFAFIDWELRFGGSPI